MAGRAGQSRFYDGVSTLDQRIGQQGEQVVSELHGRYYEQSVRKNVYFSLTLARATSLVGTAMIGNIVWNPPDSGVNLAMLKWASSIIVTSLSTTQIALAAGYQPTQPTGTTVADATGSTFLALSGASNAIFLPGKAKAYALATVLLAPVSIALLHHNTAAIATTGVDEMTGDFEGSIIVPPGGFVAVAAIGAAVAAAGQNSFLMWEEVPTL